MGTTRLTSRRRQDQGFKWARITMAVLATIGVIDTGSITLKRWELLGSLTCPLGAEGCDKVLNSPWGTIVETNALSVPLSFAGFLAYLAVLVMALVPLLPGLSDNRIDLSRRTWWGLFTVSLGMAVFSLVLVGLMVFKIQAFCFFCALSATLSVLLLILSVVGGGWDDPSPLIFRGILLALAVLLGSLIWASVLDPDRPEAAVTGPGAPPLVTTESTPAKVALAEHLTATGAVMYSAYCVLTAMSRRRTSARKPPRSSPLSSVLLMVRTVSALCVKARRSRRFPPGRSTVSWIPESNR